MKKILVSVGLAAVGTAGLHAAYAPDIGTMTATKMWSVAGTLRGFYDDNYATANKARGSYGFEVSPSFNLDVPLQQTEIGLRYTYGLYYYQDRDRPGQNPIDQTHQLDLWLDHAFTERWQTRLADSFVVAQEPELLNTGGGTLGGTPYRLKGDNIANNASVLLHTDWTRLFSTEATYENGYHDYQDSGATDANFATKGATYAGLLNRDENSIALDFQWHMQRTIMFLVGYKYDQVNYLSDEPVADSYGLTPSGFYHSKDRDNRSHIGYVGTQWDILPNLSLDGKVGAQYTDYYNDPSSSSSFEPYVASSLTYTYLPGSYAQIGFNQAENATDVATSSTSGKLTQNQESSLVYASINHKITPKLLGTIIGQLQYSTFNGGAYDNDSDTLYSLGLNLTYTFTPHFSADAGYNYDDLESAVPGRGFTRNRVYIGITAAY